MTTTGPTGIGHDTLLEEALAAITDWHGQHITYQPVAGGITNQNWLIRVGSSETTYFVKIPGVGTERFIDRTTAAEASRRASDCGCGPRLCYVLPEHGVEVTEWLTGYRSASNDDFLRPHVRLNAVRALRTFNQQPLLNSTRTIFDLIDEHLEQAADVAALLPPDLTWLLGQYEQARSALSASGVDLAPCMNDTLAANFMLDEHDHVRLIDFEYASDNDPHYELALWFGEMFFEPDVEHMLTEEYFGTVTPLHTARIQVYKALADLKWATWAMIQQRISQLEFDYHQYGAWKYQRCRSVMHDSRWTLWLSQA